MVEVITNQSGMDFIADNTFHTEESKLYKNMGVGVRSVEFVRARNDNLLFVEAKITFPNPENPNEENIGRFGSEVGEMCEKFIHSLNLLASAELGVANNDRPDDFVLPKKASITFVLVIKDHKLKWCKPIKEKILSMLPLYLKKMWKPEIYVINKRIAIDRGLAI